jgi:carbon storage regulator CsrA
MLVISRRIGEEVMVGENVRLVVSSISGNRVKLCIEAPEAVRVTRPEANPPENGFRPEREGSGFSGHSRLNQLIEAR